MLRIFLLLLGLSLSTVAAAQSDFERCAAIEAAAERLACFDALTRPPAAGATADAQTLGTTPAAPGQQILTPQAVTTVEPTTTNADERFGAENLPAPATGNTAPDRIESRLKGAFAGWDKDTVFELDNGQAWQCRDCRPVYHQAESPQVSIRRAFTGVYWLKIEGLNQQAKVRRIR